MIDPVAVLEAFARLAADLNFRDLARPTFAEAQKWSPPAAPRHVLVFTNQRGAYYKAWTDWDDPDGEPAEPIFHIGDDAVPFDFNPYSILILEGALATAHADSDPLIRLDGPHERIGLHPDGIMKRQIRLPLGQHSFARLQVNDWREWFPHRRWGPITPGEDLTRYSEGNEVVAMTDGNDTSRLLYRAIRGTYRNETYADDRDIPEGTPITTPPTVTPQVLLANAWTSTDYFLTGRRSMLTTPRLQPNAVVPDDLVDQLVLIPVGYSFPAELSTSSGSGGEARHAWWLVAPEGALPPGAWVEVQQLEESYDFVGDDPRHPEMDRATDLFGTLAAPKGRVGAFVGASGQ
ncbi:MAG TPA: hypothetical protein VD926_10755, partial [Acidimicrobiales bacterium]|nr:hypothetical protein [Acidimicrobiales bacterium]